MLSELVVIDILYKGKAEDTPKQTKGDKSDDYRIRMQNESVPRGRFFAEGTLKTSVHSSVSQAYEDSVFNMFLQLENYNGPYADFRLISRNFSYTTGHYICCLYLYYECSQKILNQ
jgi:hypothetical protein